VPHARFASVGIFLPPAPQLKLIPIKKMGVTVCKWLAIAGLCMSLPIKAQRFQVVFDGLGVASCPLYLTRVAARVIEFSL